MTVLVNSMRFGVAARRSLTTATQSNTFWDNTTKAASITLSNATRTAYAGNPGPAHAGCKSTTTRSAGRLYFEITFDNTATGNGVGVMKSSAWSSTVLPGASSNSGFSLNMGTGDIHMIVGSTSTLLVNIGAFTATQIAAFAVDITYGLGWIKKIGGNWNNDGSADPYNEIGGFDISDLIGNTCVIAAGFQDQDEAGDCQITLNDGQASFAGTVPGEYVSF